VTTHQERSATAVAHPNIALAKYWGKRDYGANLPAVPSLSVTLAGMATTTTVTFDPELQADELTLGGAPAAEVPMRRVVEMLDRVRVAARIGHFARVVSANDFPTAAGLASSASAFAALAIAATAAAGLELTPEAASDLARRSSVSAARSIFGGFVELPAGQPGDEVLSARPVAPADHWAIQIVVVVCREGPKEVSSSDGMRHTARTSPYFPAWVETAPALFAQVREGLLQLDLEQLGAAAEQSALMMHAAAIAAAPGVIYWKGATVEALEEVRRLRRSGVEAFATIDAGPHVKVITTAEEAPAVARAMEQVPGVIRTILARPGAGARIERPSPIASPSAEASPGAGAKGEPEPPSGRGSR
jgi:diphosphomevalonate decarboxylase